MNLVKYTDENEITRAAYINEVVTDPRQGIPITIPDVIDGLDWEAIPKEIHNALMERGLYSWDDVQKQQTAITGILRSVLLRKIIALYRMEDE